MKKTVIIRGLVHFIKQKALFRVKGEERSNVVGRDEDNVHDRSAGQVIKRVGKWLAT